MSTDKQNAASFRDEPDTVSGQNPGSVARETLKLLAARRLVPTPENYQRLYHEIAGTRPRSDNGPDASLARALRELADANPAVQELARMARAAAGHDWTEFGTALTDIAG